MTRKLYVANISFRAIQSDLEELFGEYGNIVSVRLIYGEQRNSHRGFGFIEFETEEAAKNAKDGLHGVTFMQRELVVDYAREKNDRFRRDFDSRDSYNRGFDDRYSSGRY